MAARILLLTGKGGTGTTTVAAATAVHASRAGHKTLLLSTDPASSVGDALTTAVGPEPAEVETGLYAQHVSARARLQRDRERLGPRLSRLLDDLGIDAAAAEHLHVLPAAAEVLVLLELRDQAEAGTWDVVVVDGGPSTAALRLLALPEALRGYLDRSLPPGRRVARAMRPGTVGATGQDLALDGLRRLEDELAGVEALLRRPATGIRLVLTPQRAALAETLRTLTNLAVLGHAPEAVVVNRLAPEGTDLSPRSRAAWQRRMVDDVRTAAGGTPVLLAPEQADEPVGADALGRLGALLLPTPEADRQLVQPGGTLPTVRVEPDGGRWLLRFALPHAQRADVRLVRRRDDLEVSVAAFHRVLRLPSLLRRCRVVEARLRSGELRVTFEPDPALWPELGAQR